VTVQSGLAPPRHLGVSSAGYGILGINRQVYSYKQINLAGGEQTRQVETPRWPAVEFVTEGMHLHLDPDWAVGPGWDPPEATKGLEHVLLSLAPVVVACDPYDLDATSDSTTIYLYDSFGAGIGFARVAFERLEEIVSYGERLIRSCDCDDGCPSCVFLSRRPDGNSGVSKPGALQVLTRLAKAMERPH
jgi:DEAD/DEAH box helicase domain-containing protein